MWSSAHLLIILTGTALWCLATTSSAHLLIICQGSGMEKSEEFTIFWSDFICKIVKGMRKILSYALKMRQDYLSPRYLDQFMSPLFHYAHSLDIFDPSNQCWDNPVSFWRHMIILYYLLPACIYQCQFSVEANKTTPDSLREFKNRRYACFRIHIFNECNN